MTKYKKDIFELVCETCGHEFIQEGKGVGDIDWTCPECKSDENTFMTKYVPGDPDFYKRNTDIGRGAGNPNTAWKR